MSRVINLAPRLFSDSYYDTLYDIQYSSIPHKQKSFYYDELSEANKVERHRPQVALKITTVINQAVQSKDNYSDVPNMSKNVFIRQCLENKASDLFNYTVGNLADMSALRCYIIVNNSIFGYTCPALSIIKSNSDMKENYDLAKYSIHLISSVVDDYLGVDNDYTYAGYNTLAYVCGVCSKNYDEDEKKSKLFDVYLRAFAMKAEVNHRLANLPEYVPESIMKPASIVFLDNLENVSHLIWHYLEKINVD